MGVGLLYSVLSFLLVFTVLVFFHELGHYLIARLNGVRVSVFSIGFGREIFGWNDSHGTRWKVSIIPLGGYVKFFGDAGPTSSRPAAPEPRSEGAPEERPLAYAAQADGTAVVHDGAVTEFSEAEKKVTFQHKRLGQRAAVVAAGPLANFVLAIILFTGLFMGVGRAVTPAIVETVLQGSPAATAGVQPGDRIVSVNGTHIEGFEELKQIIGMNPEVTMPLIVERGDRRVAMVVTPRLEVLDDDFGNKQRIGLLGVSTTAAEYHELPLGKAVVQAVDETFNVVGLTFKSLSQMVAGKRSTEEIGGPIRIARMSGQVARQGFAALVQFTAMLSINLGLINLFPIPMLDGGHLLFYAFEAVLGRPLSERAQEYGLRVGLALVMMLMIFATWNDITSLPFGKLFSHLFS